MSFFSFIFEVQFGARRGSIGHPINLALNRSLEYFSWIFSGTICCSGFAWDRNTTVALVSQELSQGSLSPVPLIKKASGEEHHWGNQLQCSEQTSHRAKAWSLVVALLHLFDTHLCYESVPRTYREQAGLSRCYNHSLAATIKITVSEEFLPDTHQNVSVFLPLAANLSHTLCAAEKELLNSLKPESTRRCLERCEKKVEQQEDKKCHWASRWKTWLIRRRNRKLWDCPWTVWACCLSLMGMWQPQRRVGVESWGRLQWIQTRTGGLGLRLHRERTYR